MKRGLLILILPLFLLAFASATIMINQQPSGAYNYGQVIEIPIKIVASTNLNNFLITELICNGNVVEVSKDTVYLTVGQEKSQKYSIPLSDSFVSNSQGNCKVKFSIEGDTSVFTNDFQLSKEITLTLDSLKESYDPEEKISVKGTAKKNTNQTVKGFLNVKVSHPELKNPIEITTQISDGDFATEFYLPKEAKSRIYTIIIEAYEEGLSQEKTNRGFVSPQIKINQIPKSIEINLANNTIDPDTTQKAHAILYDQAGERIVSKIRYQIRDSKNKLVFEQEKESEENFEYYVLGSESPSVWTISAEAQEVSNNAQFTIKTKEKLKTEIINDTIVFTNLGNVPYQKTTSIKIGAETIEIPLDLKVGESESYILRAPNGEYSVESNGMTGLATLTGKTVEAQKSKNSIGKILQSTAVNVIIWVFILGVLGFGLWTIIRKSFSRKYSAYKASKYNTKEIFIPQAKKQEFLHSENRAEVSLSIKGETTPLTGICVKIKNMNEIPRESVRETLQKIVDIAENNKAYTYEGHDSLVFLLLPAKTKTMQNEKSAIRLAEKFSDILDYHNKVFKDKLSYGISVENGEVIAKKHEGVLAFASMKNFLVNLKKLTSSSNGEVVVSENVRKNLSGVKTEKSASGDSHKITSTTSENEKANKFLEDFKRRNRF